MTTLGSSVRICTSVSLCPAAGVSTTMLVAAVPGTVGLRRLTEEFLIATATVEATDVPFETCAIVGAAGTLSGGGTESLPEECQNARTTRATATEPSTLYRQRRPPQN